MIFLTILSIRNAQDKRCLIRDGLTLVSLGGLDNGKLEGDTLSQFDRARLCLTPPP